MMLTDLTIAQARAGLRARDFSAEDLTLAHLHAIEALNPRLNAYITVSHALAMDQAHAADAALARGEARALTGIPLAIKDLFCTEGVRTTAGSNILRSFVPPYESTVTANLLRDGAIFLGKTNMDEFAMGSSNMTSAFGPVENPWKRRQDAEAVLVPGGSSGGSAAAVAARLAMGGTGTDTGGSIRQPASFCGIVGMKPTYGRCSRWGVVAFASSLDHPGPFARTVEDCAILLGSMAGHDPKDSTSADVPVPDFAAACARGVQAACASACRANTASDGMPEEIEAVWQQGLAWLRDAGAEIVDVSTPHRKYALPAYYIIAPAEASSNLARYDGVRFGLRADGDDLRELVRTHPRGRIRAGSAAAHPGRHLRAVGRVLRRLLPAGAEGAGADPARFHRSLRAGRRAADPHRAVGAIRPGREDGRSGADVPERRVHRAGGPGGRAGDLGAGGAGRERAADRACR